MATLKFRTKCAWIPLLLITTLAHANGGGLHAIVLSSWWGGGPVPFKASVEYDPVQLLGTTVGGKYRLLRVLVENGSNAPLVRFSKGEDVFEVTVKGNVKVKGILDAKAGVESDTWDELPLPVRQALLYPTELAPGTAKVVYVLVPKAALTDEPVEFKYAIRSLAEPLLIQRRPATAA